jgi:hypothetical protein
MSVVSPPVDNQPGWYLPHHGVIQPSPEGAKLRVVFDASPRNAAGCSLNESLLPGPTVQRHLSVLLLQWRNHRYVFTTDVVKMFRQILVHSDDQDLQRILWAPSPSTTVLDYRLLTVTYGTASAPFLAIRTLQELAALEKSSLPLGSSCLVEDSYVDDILSGADTFPDAVTRRDELIELLSRGKFELGKWAANYPSLMPSHTLPESTSPVNPQPVFPGQPRHDKPRCLASCGVQVQTNSFSVLSLLIPESSRSPNVPYYHGPLVFSTR